MIETAKVPTESIRQKIQAGEPLTFDEALALYTSPDIHTLGELANLVRERKHGRNAYYNINLHINYSNYCVLRCKFCSFYRPLAKNQQRAANFSSRGESTEQPARSSSRGEGPEGIETSRGLSATNDSAEFRDDNGGYELSLDEIVRRAKHAYARGATEVHIVGGLHPKLPFEYYTDMMRAIRQACPHMHIKAFTAIEIIHFTRITKPRLSIAEVLAQLRDAGLGSMPGGGAEIFDDRVHDEAFKNKVGEAEWFEVHRTAHELGIFTNATILYGHVETPEERLSHLFKLREHQAESLESRKAHFNCVIPLSFIPDGSELDQLPGPDGLTDLRTLAISRLICDNIPHIKAFWIMQTPKVAQVSLNWGVDDIDGTVVYYDITKREGAGTTHQELTADKLKRLIAEAGCEAVERDTLYRRVVRDAVSWGNGGHGPPYADGHGPNGTAWWGVEGEKWRVAYDPRSADAVDVNGSDSAMHGPGEFVELMLP